MKTKDIRSIIAEHPDAVFQHAKYNHTCFVITEITEYKKYSWSTPTMRIDTRRAQPDGTVSPFGRFYAPGQIGRVVAHSLAEYAELAAQEEAKAEAKRQERLAAEEAAEAARVVAVDALTAYGHEDLRTHLINAFGGKASVHIGYLSGKVTIEVMADTAVEFVEGLLTPSA